MIYGDGEQSRDFTFIKDIVSANIAGAFSDARGEVFNIDGGSRVTVNEVLSALRDIVGYPLSGRYVARQLQTPR